MILDVLEEGLFCGFLEKLFGSPLTIFGKDLFRFPPLCIESMLARAFVQNLHFSILFTSQNFSQHPKQHSTTSTAMCLLQNKLVGIQFPN